MEITAKLTYYTCYDINIAYVNKDTRNSFLIDYLIQSTTEK